ncbi:SpoIIE family protein phosphatase [Streptomyces azureus]|uniref:PPM-type phosphatase domain-containing protein n=1 Tax=Streptomyces azureus TaxID=146537 RepID=A0A0K8PY81_STRAJ|nr:SpoIIE family protein phosphatase [Streptomyces azureus]GAP52771.1 uncharacterized protein SAZU_7650 [Streptomyces azureus]
MVYLADIQQRRLVPLTDVTPPLLVDDSLAGWTYRTQSLRMEESESGGITAWIPLVDGAERLGVLAVHAPSLKPGDRVLMYTDGATEARGSDGAEFGLERFADYIIRATAAGELAPETLRRLIHSILEASTSRLRDGATLLMFEWSRPAR